MATENVVSKKYRILSDVANKVWDVISFFTLAKDVETTNGKNLETTCGSITGITSSLTSTSTTMAASASAIKQLNDKIADLNSNLIKLTTKSITQPLIKKNQGINTFVFDFAHEVVGIVSITMPTLYNGYIQEIVSIDGNVVTLKNYCNNEGGDFTLTVCGY